MTVIYDIFEEEVIVEKVDGQLTSVVTGNWASQTSLTHFPPESTSTPYAKIKRGKEASSHLILKRDDTVVPAVCYDICNDAYLEAQQVGKTAALCADGSPFENYYQGCDSCITANEPQQKLTTKAYLQTKFSQFINYCESAPAESQVQPSSTPEAQQTTPANVQTTSQAAPNTSGEPSPISTPTPPPPPPSTTATPTSELETSTPGTPTPESSIPETSSEAEPTETSPIPSPSESSTTETITSLSSGTISSTPGPSSVTTAGAPTTRRSSFAALILPLLACIFFL
ncbi:putative glycoprotein x protein [Phaeoacremonium minimum UCRPA7]|uniref:Putative glycoprotein x protein n=1 Tax=Phaeoacremonium minimum (strain UCR-PA7) TaxID=1286976 RepID=R8BX96_PHAM7|nr:putative glycoprotein x protein [Phaeoacremonium minimum UCRPA7]EOO03978.1 putative glycoprotein x protein [Phaeoacremonium minimum UCRPA7]